jgi:hypothetical protein
MTEITTVMDPPAAGDLPGEIPSTPAATGDKSGPGTTNGGSIDLDSMSQEQLEAVLNGEELPQEEAQPEPEQPANGDGDDVENPPAQQPDSKPKRIRMNVGDLPEGDIDLMFQVRDLIKRGEATDAKDAMRKLAGLETPQREAPQEPAQPAPQESKPQSSKVEAIQEKIESLRQQRVEARTVEFDFQKADNLSDEIAAAMLELKEAERESKVADIQISDWAAKEAEALATVTRQFPDLRDEGSELYEEYAAQHALATANNDPVFNDPDWSFKLVERANQRLARLTGQAAPPRPIAPTSTVRPTAQTPAKPSRPVGSLGGSGSDGPPLSPNQLQSLIETADPEALEAALNAPDEATATSMLLQRRRR